MRPYEVMVIFDVGLEDADIRQQVERVLDLVRSRGGTPGEVSHWGRRTFAYEVKHRTEGYYVLVELMAEPDAVAEVDRLLTLEDSVLRHKVIRQPEKAAGRSSGRRNGGGETAAGTGAARSNGAAGSGTGSDAPSSGPAPGRPAEAAGETSESEGTPTASAAAGDPAAS